MIKSPDSFGNDFRVSAPVAVCMRRAPQPERGALLSVSCEKSWSYQPATCRQVHTFTVSS